MIDNYHWRYALATQWRATEECESHLMRTMVEQGLTLRQMVAILHVSLDKSWILSNELSEDEVR